MRKILATILASMSISGGALAYELERIKPPEYSWVRQVCIPGNFWHEKDAIKKAHFSDIHWAPINGVYLRDGRINPFCDTIVKDGDRPISKEPYIRGGNRSKLYLHAVTPPVLKKELVCTRIEGCEINLNAATEEEYCPTCVWKSEMKKIEIEELI